MKKLLFLLFLVFAAGPAMAFHLGPATPMAAHGEVTVGAGYFLYQAEWNGIDAEQNRGYLHLGYGLGMEDEPRWEAYLRGGAADLEASSEDFDADFEPFIIAGLKGAFWDGPRFGWGMVVQGGGFRRFRGQRRRDTGRLGDRGRVPCPGKSRTLYRLRRSGLLPCGNGRYGGGR